MRFSRVGDLEGNKRSLSLPMSNSETVPQRLLSIELAKLLFTFSWLGVGKVDILRTIIFTRTIETSQCLILMNVSKYMLMYNVMERSKSKMI